jgi:PAS domain S-box-containing protein
MPDEVFRNDSLALTFTKMGLSLGMPFTTLNNKTFQSLFDFASIGILITNQKGEILMANKYIEHQFGYEEDELVGARVEKLIPPRYTERHVHHRERYAKDPHSRPMGLGMELAGLKKNGTEFPVEVSLGHYAIGDDKYALAFINDITQRKETEEAIIQLNAHLEQKVKEGSQSLALTVEQLGKQINETERKDMELQRVNTFLNNIWNHAGAIIMVGDKDGVIQFFNPAAEKALGYTSDELVSNHTLAIFHTQEELRERAAKLTIQTGKRIEPNFDVYVAMAELNQGSDQEWHYLRKDGSTFYVSLDITPLKDSHDQVTSYLAIAIDISEKKIAEIELRAALEKEKELNELKSRFVSMASHEFRTPLSAILSSTYLLSKYTNTEEQPQRSKHIQRIVASVTSLTEILNDFLSVGKIEEGNIHARYAEYDINQQMGEIIHEVKHLLKKGQQINFTHFGKTSTVNLDNSMMKHIVTNLLSNAIKFSPEFSPIEVTTEKRGDILELAVKDSGIGIPKEDQENLFKRFFRSSNVTNIQGTGLGLHIVKKYAEMMNGHIECTSELGKGTTFTITFKKSKRIINENDFSH